MIIPIPGAPNCGILRGSLSIWKNGECIHDDANKPATITLLGKEVTKMPVWIYCISVIGFVDEFDLEHLHFTHVLGINSRFPWTAWYDKPKIFKEGYRVVPGFPLVAVNEHGDVVHAITGETLRQYQNSRGYSFITYPFDFDRSGRHPVGIHRLVALAWINNDDPKHKWVVNHIKGGENPLCNDVRNLEWVTPRGNAIHARNTGLMTFAKPCKIRSRKTGEIRYFPSIAEMSNFLGIKVTKEENYYLVRRGNKLFNNEWEVRLNGDDRPWTYSQNCMNVEPARYIVKVTEPGSETKVFNGIRTLIKHYKLWNMGGTSCKRAVNRLHQEHPSYKIEVIDQYNLRPIEVKNLETGEVTVYQSNKELHEKTGWCKTTVLDAINYAGKRKLYGKYVLRRQTNKPWPKDIRVTQNQPVEVTIINKSTKKVYQCKSLREAARLTGFLRSDLQRMARNPHYSDPYEVTVKAPASPSDRCIKKKVNC